MTRARAANDGRWREAPSRTSPLAGTLRTIPGYPEKLRIYLIGASPFWQARCFHDGRMRSRSLRTSDVRQAMRAAREFYEELLAERVRAPQARVIAPSGQPTMEQVAERLLASERARMRRGELSGGSLAMLESQLRRQVLPALGRLPLREVQYAQLEAFVQAQSSRGLSPTTLHHYLIAIRKVLKHGCALQVIEGLPAMPAVRQKATPRGGFSLPEYRALVRTARGLARAADQRARQRGSKPASAVDPQVALLVRFMVNSFLRPHDIKLLQHRHVQLVPGASPYLRLTAPETKRKSAPVVTMPAAVGIYRRLRANAVRAGVGDDDDYVFLPGQPNRGHAMWLIDQQFRKVLDAGLLRMNAYGRARTLYSLRHTAIMFRLLYGKGIDLLTLARNARTSVAMIERFYASNLTAEMNVELLHSRRRREVARGDMMTRS